MFVSFCSFSSSFILPVFFVSVMFNSFFVFIFLSSPTQNVFKNVVHIFYFSLSSPPLFSSSPVLFISCPLHLLSSSSPVLSSPVLLSPVPSSPLISYPLICWPLISCPLLPLSVLFYLCPVPYFASVSHLSSSLIPPSSLSYLPCVPCVGSVTWRG